MARLLVLWILSERASYGYEIKKALTDQGMAFWFGLEDASVYQVLRTLVRHGHAREVGVEREGARPPRTRYALTPSGRRHYADLLRQAGAQVSLPVAGIDVVLAAQGDLDRDELDAVLADRGERLRRLRDQIGEHRAGCPHPAVAARNLALVDAELAWLDDLDPDRSDPPRSRP
jgi:DNA-binding PadR family transcriptional regulator